MAWNDPNDAPFDVGDVLSSQTMKDYVRDNLLALRALNYAVLRHDLSTVVGTTSTSFVDMNPTNLKLELEISSDRLLCIATMMVNRLNSGGVPQGIGYLDLAVNMDLPTNIVRASNHADGLLKYADFDLPIVLIGYWTGLVPGNKKVTIQARTNNASYPTSINNAMTVNMLAMEI